MTTSKSGQVIDLLMESAAYNEAQVPQCVWLSETKLKSVDLNALPAEAVNSIQLADAFGDLPAQDVQARLYGSRGNLKVLVTHEPPNSENLQHHLTPAGYLQLLTYQVSVAPLGLARVTYVNPDAKYPDLLAEYSIDVEGEDFYDMALQGHEIAHSIESSVSNKVRYLTGVFEDLAESRRLVTIADVDRVDHAASNQEKGVALEDLIAHLFVSLGGLRLDPGHGRNVRTDNAEIDHVFYNQGVAEWASGSPLILTECKNWSGAVQRSALDSLETKIRDRGGQCRVGIFISWSGFRSGFESELMRAAREPYLILTMDGEGIRRSVERGNFRGYVQDRYEYAEFVRGRRDRR